MPEQTVEFRLGQVVGGLKALVDKVAEMHEDVIRRIEQHDGRDDERFKSHSMRLDTIERWLAVHDGAGANSDAAMKRHFTRRTAIMAASIGLAGGLAGAALVATVNLILHFLGGH